MTLVVRDGRFDVVIVAGPRVSPWPSAGVRALSASCAELGLTVGVLGGEQLTARGVLPLPGTGGLVLAEDLQQRIHRIQARAVVRFNALSQSCDPFEGWRSQGLIPLATAQKLQAGGQLRWNPATVVLGTGNRALRFGSALLEAGPVVGAREVYCVESGAQWGAKRFAGWEVERRRFEMLGGKLIEAKPLSLTEKAALLWELRLEDAHGVRVIEVARVVSAGPFRESPGIREYPPGSFLFEVEQTAAATRAEDVEGWALEEERGRWLAAKITKALVTELGEKREEVERIQKRARARLRRYGRHREEPFSPAYQGKWMASADGAKVRAFSGVPKAAHKARAVASVECFETIACNLCEKACPESAIDITRAKKDDAEADPILTEADCTACGLCLTACPSGATLLVHEQENRSTSQLTLSWRGSKPWAAGEFATLVNRRGESLGTGRVSGILPSEAGAQLVQVDVPTHLVWDARGLRRGRSQNMAAEQEAYVASVSRSDDPVEKVEITLDGEKRLVRPGVPVSMALFETGQARPGDGLLCPDGSCGLCEIDVDGTKKLACRTDVRKGMAIRLGDGGARGPEKDTGALCPCLGVRREQIVERMKQGSLQSPEAVVSITHVGGGKCHGQLCADPFRRALSEQGLDVSQWVDWRFPWADWTIGAGSGD